MQKEELQELVRKFLAKTATEEEVKTLTDWYREHAEGNVELFGEEGEDKRISLQEIMLQNIREKSGLQQQKEHSYHRVWMRVAAAVVILLGAGSLYYFYTSRHSNDSLLSTQSTTAPEHIMPGKNGAILTLADGRKVSLDDAAVGKISGVTGTELTKANDSSLVYQNNSGVVSVTSYNTLETPKGRQFSVTLPDGTKVWLNAASSLKYPVAFTGKERLVELKGEAYFEVVHNSAMPFRVKATGQVVEDIGTSFDINAYNDEEKTKTTLVEGALKIQTVSNGKGLLLRPGQMAVNANNKINVVKADIKEVIAWKNGYFSFEDEDLHAVMRQLARWYDVDVVFANGVPERFFSGHIDRQANIQQTLQILSYAKVRFKIQGRTIQVLP